MLMMAGVALAFIAAHTAGLGAGPQHHTNDLLVRAGPAHCHGAGGGAHVGAVEVEADALRELLHRGLTEAGVGAGCTGTGAGVALLDAADQRVVGIASYVPVRANDLLHVHL